MCRPAWAMRVSSPAVFSATVFPPVFGPVTISARSGGCSTMSTGTGSAGAPARAGVSSRLVTALISSGCRAARSSNVSSVASCGSTPPTAAANAARACTTSRSVAAVRVRRRSAARRRNADDSPSRTRRISSSSCCSRATISLLRSDGAERFEEQAGAARRAPVHDARDGGAMLRSDDQHETPVALGDHPVLQVLGGLPAPQKRFEVAAQPVALLAEAAANRLQLGARVVVDVAGGIDLPADVLALALPGGAAVHDRGQGRIRPAAGVAHGPARAFDRLEKVGELSQIDGGQGMRLDGEPRQDPREVAGRFEGNAPFVGGEKPDSLGGVGEGGLHGVPVGERLQLCELAGSQRCQGMTGDDLDHAVELEGRLGSCVHRGNGAGSLRTLARPGLPSDRGRCSKGRKRKVRNTEEYHGAVGALNR